MNAQLAPPSSRAAAAPSPATALVLQPMWQPELSPRLLASCRLQIGAAPECDLRVDVPGVAERHATVLAGPQRVVLRAWDPRTWVNDLPVQETTLRVGDRVAIGPVQFRVRAATADDILAQLPGEPTPSKPQQHPPETVAESFSNVVAPQTSLETHESILCPPGHLAGEWVSEAANWPTIEAVVEAPPWIAAEPRNDQKSSAPPPTPASTPADVEALVAERLRERQAAWDAERSAFEQQQADWVARTADQQRQLDARYKDLERLTAQLDRRQESLARQEAEQSAQAARLEHLTAQLRQQQAELRQVREELQTERERLEAVATQARADLAAEAERQVAAWQAWESTRQQLTSELTDQFAELEARKAELTERANQLEAERSAVHVARTELETERRLLAEAQADFEADRERWHAACQHADNELAELRAALQQQQAQLLADIRRRAQAEAELLAARQELQRDRRRFAEQHADWLKDREIQSERLSQRRRQLEDECASLEQQHRVVAELVAALEVELTASRKDREALRLEWERLAKAQAEAETLQARQLNHSQVAASEIQAREESLQQQLAELAAEQERCNRIRRELEEAQERLDCEREQFVRDQSAWQQQRAIEQQALAAQREQLEAQTRAVEFQRTALDELQTSLQHELTVTVLEREQLQAERDRLRTECLPRADAVPSLPSAAEEAVHPTPAPAVGPDHRAAQDSGDEFAAFWEHPPRSTFDNAALDQTATRPIDSWHNEQPAWDDWPGSTFTHTKSAVPFEPTSCDAEANSLGTSTTLAPRETRSHVAATQAPSEIPELVFADEWNILLERHGDVTPQADQHAARSAQPHPETAGHDKSIVDSVNSLRQELARLFNLPEDFAEREAVPPPAPEPAEENSGPTVAELVANIPADETAYAIEIPAEPHDGVVEDWRTRLQSLVGQPVAEPTEPLPSTETTPSESAFSIKSAEESAPLEDSIDAYMERLLARHRKQRSQREERGHTHAHDSSTGDFAIEIPAETFVSSTTPAADTAAATPFDVTDDSHLKAAPRHPQDKHVVRAHLQSFREVANLSARTALARHGWRVVRTEIAVNGLLTIAALCGAAGFVHAPFWHGVRHWDRSLVCLIAAGWTFRRCITAIRRLRQCRSAETRISNIAVGSALRHASTATRHPKHTETIEGGDQAVIPAEADPEFVPPSPVE